MSPGTKLMQRYPLPHSFSFTALQQLSGIHRFIFSCSVNVEHIALAAVKAPLIKRAYEANAGLNGPEPSAQGDFYCVGLFSCHCCLLFVKCVDQTPFCSDLFLFNFIQINMITPPQSQRCRNEVSGNFQ